MVRTARFLAGAVTGTAGLALTAVMACSPSPSRDVSPPPAGFSVQANADPKVQLGFRLFFEKRLSADGTVSCGTCHQPKLAFTDGQVTAVGIRAQRGPRNTPTILTAASNPVQFWDGRSPSLEDQSLKPIQSPIEMGSSIPAAMAFLNREPQYRQFFKRLYGGEATPDRYADAVATFERAVILHKSAFDRFADGDLHALSASQQRGFQAFKDKGCVFCHKPPEFKDGRFQNIGVGTDKPNPDIGRQAVTGQAGDFAKFKTPTLRNIAKTAPYFHDGSAKTLDAVLDVYHRGGIPNANLNRFLRPANFTAQERQDVIAFLQSLTSPDNVDLILQ